MFNQLKRRWSSQKCPTDLIPRSCQMPDINDWGCTQNPVRVRVCVRVCNRSASSHNVRHFQFKKKYPPKMARPCSRVSLGSAVPLLPTTLWGKTLQACNYVISRWRPHRKSSLHKFWDERTPLVFPSPAFALKRCEFKSLIACLRWCVMWHLLLAIALASSVFPISLLNSTSFLARVFCCLFGCCWARPLCLEWVQSTQVSFLQRCGVRLVSPMYLHLQHFCRN